MNGALRATGICKTYGTVRANAEVDVDIRPGEIHAILGENGAGKSTLMRILYGMEVPDSGQIELEGKPIELWSPREAMAPKDSLRNSISRRALKKPTAWTH